MDDLLLGRPPLKEVRTDQPAGGIERWGKPLCLAIYWLMGGGPWSGHMVAEESSGNLAYSRDAVWGTARRKCEGVVEPHHVDAIRRRPPRFRR